MSNPFCEEEADDWYEEEDQPQAQPPHQGWDHGFRFISQVSAAGIALPTIVMIGALFYYWLT